MIMLIIALAPSILLLRCRLLFITSNRALAAIADLEVNDGLLYGTY